MFIYYKTTICNYKHSQLQKHNEQGNQSINQSVNQNKTHDDKSIQTKSNQSKARQWIQHFIMFSTHPLNAFQMAIGAVGSFGLSSGCNMVDLLCDGWYPTQISEYFLHPHMAQDSEGTKKTGYFGEISSYLPAVQHWIYPLYLPVHLPVDYHVCHVYYLMLANLLILTSLLKQSSKLPSCLSGWLFLNSMIISSSLFLSLKHYAFAQCPPEYTYVYICIYNAAKYKRKPRDPFCLFSFHVL